MKSPIYIVSERLILRSISIEDSDSVFNYRSDALANQYQGWIPKSVEDVHSFITNKTEPLVNLPDTWHQLVICKKEDSVIIGDIGIHFLSFDNSTVEIGFTLDKKQQAKGYATEAVGVVINYLFNTLNKQCVIASIDPRNEKSIRLVKRLRFREDETGKEKNLIHSEWVDDLIFSISKENWIN